MADLPPITQGPKPLPGEYDRLTPNDKAEILLELIRETDGPEDEIKIYNKALTLAFSKTDFEHETIDGISIAVIAASRGFKQLIEFIIRHKFIDVNHMDSQGGTMLKAALREGHEELVDILLKNGADPNQTDIGTMPIHDAVSSGKTSIVKKIKDLPDVNLNAQSPGFYHSPLMQAAYYGKADIFELLLKDTRVDPNLQGHSGNTALHILCSEDNNQIDDQSRKRMLRALLKHPKIDLDIENEEGFNAFDLADYEGIDVSLDVLRPLYTDADTIRGNQIGRIIADTNNDE